MEETYIVNDVKEKCCYVSSQFAADLETCRFATFFRSSNGQFDLSTTTFRADRSRNTIVQEYVLPDFSRNREGYIRQPDGQPLDGEQILYMGNERFSIPEVLFCPDHIGTSTLREIWCLQEMTSCLAGLHQAGLGETIAQSISLLPEDLHGMFWANIGLIGGSTKFPGFAARL